MNTKKDNNSRVRLWVMLFLSLFGGYEFTQPLAASPFAYIANACSNTITVIDTANNAVIGSPIPVDSSPQAIAITPNGKYAYVTNGNPSTVRSLTLPTTPPQLQLQWDLALKL